MFWYAFRSLKYNTLRSALTVLGIVIGIAAVVSLISLSQGLSFTINEMMGAFGTNNVMVMPGSLESQFGGGGAPTGRPVSGRLFEKDISTLQGVAGVGDITGYIMNSQTLRFREEELKVSLMGVNPDALFRIYKDFYVLREGRFPRDNDRNVVLLGANIADSTFEGKISVGQFIYVGPEEKKFRVVGILEKKGGLEGEDNDNAAIVHFDDLKGLSTTTLSKNEINGIIFQVKEGFNVSRVAKEAEIKLAAAHHLRAEDKDFAMITSESMMEQMGAITGLLSLFLAVISSISLVVGGVGVMNTMYMAVMERTREIGTLKAIGASDNAVLALFVVESGLLGMLGGIIGILIGGFVALIVIVAGFYAVFDLQLILFALFFSFAVGVISGLFPAWDASKLPPIEALRYE